MLLFIRADGFSTVAAPPEPHGIYSSNDRMPPVVTRYIDGTRSPLEKVTEMVSRKIVAGDGESRAGLSQARRRCPDARARERADDLRAPGCAQLLVAGEEITCARAKCCTFPAGSPHQAEASTTRSC